MSRALAIARTRLTRSFSWWAFPLPFFPSPSLRRLSLDAFFHSAASKTACDDPSHVTRGSEVTLQLNNLIDVRRWILACGSHAEVLDPPELRREITEEIQRTAANYHLKSRICPEQ